MNLVVNLTPTGMIPTKEMTEHVPITPAEIAAEVQRCCEAGVSIVHVHARDSLGRPTTCKNVYADIIGRIREVEPALIICVSCSGRETSELEKRSAVLELEGSLKPDMGSLTLSSLNFARQASINEPDMVQALARIMRERGIKPELEAFDLGMINYAQYLIRKGLLDPPYYFNLILGNVAGAQANLVHVGAMLSSLPPNSVWTLGGLGDTQLSMNTTAIAQGGGIRVGLEDNIWYDAEHTRKATNADLLERALRIADLHGRQPERPEELRKRLRLPAHAG